MCLLQVESVLDDNLSEGACDELRDIIAQGKSTLLPDAWGQARFIQEIIINEIKQRAVKHNGN